MKLINIGKQDILYNTTRVSQAASKILKKKLGIHGKPGNPTGKYEWNAAQVAARTAKI